MKFSANSDTAKTILITVNQRFPLGEHEEFNLLWCSSVT